eukprot:6589082-Alexandrium_andersonii.AAC.1
MGSRAYSVLEPPGQNRLVAVRLPRGLHPLGPPRKRLQRARRPFSSSPSDSARKMAPKPPDEAFWGGI